MNYNPLFRFDKTSKELFFDLINLKNNVLLTEDDVEVSSPVMKGRTLTEVQLAPTISSNLKGRVTVSYDRLDLNQFFFGIPINLEISEEEELNEELISNKIFEKWNVLIEPTDITLTIDSFGETLPTHVIVTAKEESLTWIGFIEVWILPDNHLSTIFSTNALSFNTNTIKINAFIYSMEKNLINISEEVIDILEEGKHIFTLDTETIKIVNQLKVLTEDEWDIKQSKLPFNLMDSYVVYHGLYDDNDPVTYMIVIRLSTACQNLFGNLVIQYTKDELEDIVTNTELNGFNL